MRLEDLETVEARLQAMITVIEHDRGTPRVGAGTLKTLHGLRWAAGQVRQRMALRLVPPLPAVRWQSRAA